MSIVSIHKIAGVLEANFKNVDFGISTNVRHKDIDVMWVDGPSSIEVSNILIREGIEHVRLEHLVASREDALKTIFHLNNKFGNDSFFPNVEFFKIIAGPNEGGYSTGWAIDIDDNVEVNSENIAFLEEDIG